MRAVVVRCPNCNANLQIANTVTSTTCSYCGTVSRIQMRTAMFQLPKAPSVPVQPTEMTNAERKQWLQQFVTMPIAVQKASMFLVFLPFVLMAVIGGGVFYTVQKTRGSFGGMLTGTMTWAGRPPAVMDVDGDGVGDLIGLARYIHNDDRVHFAAYSGKTGAQLWESESLGNYSDRSQDRFGAVGGVLYVSTKEGKLIARNAKNKGTVKWEISLGEKLDAMCGNGNELSVETADRKWWIVDAAGKKREGKKLIRLDRDYTHDDAKTHFASVGGEGGDVCMPLGVDHRTPAGVVALPRWRDLANIEGMQIAMLIRRPGGPAIALGAKAPGTAVPMLARLGDAPVPTPEDPKQRRAYRDEKALLPGAAWKAEVPAVDPLNSRLEAQNVALSNNAVFALYQISNSKHHLAAFDVASGKRLWDREISHGTWFRPNGLTSTGDAVVLSTGDALTAYAATDGSERYRIGKAD